MSEIHTTTKDGRTVITVNNPNVKYVDQNQFEVTSNTAGADTIVVGQDYVHIAAANDVYSDPAHSYACQETQIGIHTNNDTAYVFCDFV